MFVIGLLLVAGSVEASSQVWGLTSQGDGAGHFVLERAPPEIPEGSVFLGGDPVTWVADEVASATVDFQQGAWGATLRHYGLLAGMSLVVTLGTVEPSGEFVAGGGTGVIAGSGLSSGEGASELELRPLDDFVIEAGESLALRVELESATGGARILTGGDAGGSRLASPASDPGYPVWELPSAILLGIAVLVVGCRFTRSRI